MQQGTCSLPLVSKRGTEIADDVETVAQQGIAEARGEFDATAAKDENQRSFRARRSAASPQRFTSHCASMRTPLGRGAGPRGEAASHRGGVGARSDAVRSRLEQAAGAAAHRSDSGRMRPRAAAAAQQRSSRPPRSDECFATKKNASSDASRTIAWRQLVGQLSAGMEARSRVSVLAMSRASRPSLRAETCSSRQRGLPIDRTTADGACPAFMPSPTPILIGNCG